MRRMRDTRTLGADTRATARWLIHRRIATTIGVVVAGALAVMALVLMTPAGPSSASPVASAVAATAPATLYVPSANNPVAPGDSLTVDVRLRSDTLPVNAVQADLNYPTAALQYVSTDVNNGVWGVTASISGGAGRVSIEVGSTTPVTGDTLVAKVTFTALEAGIPAVAVASSSLALSADANTNLLIEQQYGGAGPGTPSGGSSGSAQSTSAVPVRARIASIRWLGRTLRVRLRCPATASSRCRVVLSIHGPGGRRVSKTSAITIRSGHSRTAAITLAAATARRIRRHPAAFRGPRSGQTWRNPVVVTAGARGRQRVVARLPQQACPEARRSSFPRIQPCRAASPCRGPYSTATRWAPAAVRQAARASPVRASLEQRRLLRRWLLLGVDEAQDQEGLGLAQHGPRDEPGVVRVVAVAQETTANHFGDVHL